MNDGMDDLSLEAHRQSVGKYEKATELASQGNFTGMRDTLETRENPHEIHLLLNFLRTLPVGTSRMPQGHFSRSLFSAERVAIDYHEALFSALKEAGSTNADRPAIEKYFADVRTENEKPRTSGTIAMDDEERRRLAGLNETLDNAAKALDKVFPLESK